MIAKLKHKTDNLRAKPNTSKQVYLYKCVQTETAVDAFWMALAVVVYVVIKLIMITI